jgi:hypothetical protein
MLVGQGQLALSTIVTLRAPAATPTAARGWSIAGPVPLGYLDDRSYTEHKKDRAENSMIHSPGKTCTKERQGSK